MPTMSRAATGAAAAIAGACAAAFALHAAPAAIAMAGVRRGLLPALAGIGRPGHIALTFDDGPDPTSTPYFLRALAEADVRATFFVLGIMLDRDPGLGREIVARGHELAVHGWDHRNLLRRSPYATYDDISRTRDLVIETTGVIPRWYRPPYGVLTGAAVVTCRSVGLRPRLWTTWGRDWEATATGDSVMSQLTATFADGGTVLLHDSDCTSAPGSWRHTLAALPRFIDWVRDRDLTLGPLAGHRSTQSR